MLHKATLIDIARELYTTAIAVSRALSNHPRINNKTKNSVHLAASKLNYKKTGWLPLFVPVKPNRKENDLIRIGAV